MASEEIDYKTVCEEPLIVIPYGLGYFTKDAVAELNKGILKAGSLCTLQVLLRLCLLSFCLIMYPRNACDFSRQHQLMA